MNCAPGAGVEPAISRVKAGSPTADGALPEWSRLPGADPGLLPYRGRVTAVCDGRAPAQAMAVVSASRTNGVSVLTPVLGVLGGSRTRAVSDLDAALPTKSGNEDMEPPPGADPGHPPYEGGAAAVRGGVSWGIKIRT